MTVRLTAHRRQPGDAVMTTRWPLIFLAALCGMGTVAMFAATEDVWVL